MEASIDRFLNWLGQSIPQWLWDYLEKIALYWLKRVDDCAVCFYWRARLHGWLDLLIVIGVIYVFSQTCK